jgi:hypothetical protein
MKIIIPHWVMVGIAVGALTATPLGQSKVVLPPWMKRVSKRQFDSLKLAHIVWYNLIMGVITKKIGKNKYAYLVIREGKKVVHKYLGSINNPQVAKIILEKKEISAIPERFQSLFWDTSLSNIHIKRNARYVIERVLEFGDMDALNWLQKVYSVHAIVDVLNLSKIITKKSKIFWMIWFGVVDA